MKVKLIQMTQNPIDVMWTAARTCYSEKSPVEMWEDDCSRRNTTMMFIAYMSQQSDLLRIPVFFHSPVCDTPIAVAKVVIIFGLRKSMRKKNACRGGRR